MGLITDLATQGAQMMPVVLTAPAFVGFVNKVRAQLHLRRGAPISQPYRDLFRLLRKDVVLAKNASWLFRIAPYVIFATTWIAAALVPTFASGLMFSWSADLIAIMIRVTGNKASDKIYCRHTGYPGGIRATSFKQMQEKHPGRALEKAVKGMLPKGPLGYAMVKKLKVYAGATHPHTAQQPKLLEI